MNMKNLFKAAKKEGRICTRCGWMITKLRWKNGKQTLCGDCEDAMKGVNTPRGHVQDQQEVIDMTGEMT